MPINCQIDQISRAIILLPNFSPEIGHRSTYPEEVMKTFADDLGINCGIVTSSFAFEKDIKTLNLPLRQPKSKAPWGSDNGVLSPWRLYMQLKGVLNEESSGQILIYSFESSLSLIVALTFLLRENRDVWCLVNLIDDPFWIKLLKSKNPLSHIVTISLHKILLNNKGRFILTTNSGKAKSLFPKMIRNRLQIHRAIHQRNLTADALSSGSEGNYKNQTIAVVAWPGDETLVVSFLKAIFENYPDLYTQVRVKTKSVISKELLYRSLKNLNMPECNIVSNDLTQLEYVKFLGNSMLTIIAYSDMYHYVGGSGVVVDSLCLGTPVLVPDDSALSELCELVNGGIPFKPNETQSQVLALRTAIEAEFAKEGSSDSRYSLAKRSKSQFALRNQLTRILEENFAGREPKGDGSSWIYGIALFFCWEMLKIYTAVRSFVRKCQ